MHARTAAVVSLALVAAGGALVPASAAPKPITKTYSVGPLTPDPTPAARDICDPVTPTARHTEPFKVPAAGTLKVDIEFQGDWALGLRDAKGARLAESDGSDLLVDESMQAKFKKPTEVLIDACNFAGAPTATVTYTFTFA